MARIQRSKTLQPYNRIQRQPWSWGIGGGEVRVGIITCWWHQMARIQRSKTLQPYNRIQRQPWSWGIGGGGGGGCGYSGKITTTRCVDFWGGDIVWDPWTLRQSAILWWVLGGQIDLLQRQQLLSFLGLGLTQCFFFSVIIIPKYCQSSQNQPYWESIKAVATRAAGHLREWDLISNHVINLWLLSAIAHESFSLQSLRHSSKRVLQCWQ